MQTVDNPEPQFTTPDISESESSNDQKLWFLLHLLSKAKNKEMTLAKLKDKLKPKKVQQAFGLNVMEATSIIENHQELIDMERPTKRTITFRLTDNGIEKLHTLSPHPDFVEKPPEGADAPEHMRKYQEAFLLLQLMQEEDYKMRKGDANNKMDKHAAKDMELSTPLANFRRNELINRNLIRVEKDGKADVLCLTDEGREYVSTLDQYPLSKFSLQGSAINDLISAVRETAGSFRQSTELLPVPENLAQVVYEQFEELLREKYSYTRLVPIHEIRKSIHEKYGSNASSHATLDELIKQLWRDGMVKMVPKSDLKDTSSQEMNDSIPGVNETLFYLEKPHVNPVSI